MSVLTPIKDTLRYSGVWRSIVSSLNSIRACSPASSTRARSPDSISSFCAVF